MFEVHRHRLWTWLRAAPWLRRTAELVSPDGRAFCWLGSAAWTAARDPRSGITFVPADPDTEAHFRVGGHAMPSEHDGPLIAAMADWYGVDLWEVTVDPATLPTELGDEVSAALDVARAHRPGTYATYEWAREGPGWGLWALSDLEVPGRLLAHLTAQAIGLPPTAGHHAGPPIEELSAMSGTRAPRLLAAVPHRMWDAATVETVQDDGPDELDTARRIAAHCVWESTEAHAVLDRYDDAAEPGEPLADRLRRVLPAHLPALDAE